MRTQTLASTLLISAVVMGCVGPGRRSQPSRTSLGDTSSSVSGDSVMGQLQELMDRRDHRAIITFTKAVLSDRHKPRPSAHTRAVCEHAKAQSQAATGLHLSSLGSFNRAFNLVASENSPFCATVLEDWADEQMRAGQADEAKKHYKTLLGWNSVSPSRRQRLTASLVVACETVGAMGQALEYRGRLGRGAPNLLDAARARLADVVTWQPLPTVAKSRSQGIPQDSREILPGLRTRLHWSAAPIGSNYDKMTKIKAITVHHSAIAAPAAGSAAAQVRAIQIDHQGTQGWADIGYHFLIDAQGGVWEGRRLIQQGAHAGNTSPGLNVGNIGVCLLGNFEIGPVPAAQEASLLEVLDALSGWFGLPRSAVQPHQFFKSSTLCPGVRLLPIVTRYRNDWPLSASLSSTPATLVRQ